MIRSAFMIFIAAFFLSGCYTVGSERISDPEFVAKIQPGTTTMKEVTDLFGPPFKKDRLSGGGQEWFYFCGKMKATRLIPGSFLVPGAHSDNDYLTIIFDRSMVVKEYKVGKGSI